MSSKKEVKCLKCNDLGWVYTDRGVIKCDCKFSHITDSIYERMNIPKRYRDKDFENFYILNEKIHKRLLNKLMNYVLSNDVLEGQGLFLYGKPGVGKTHLAVATLKELFRKRKIIGLFYDTRNLLFDIKATFDGKSSGREILDDVISTPVLVLDDLGSERLSDWARDILHYIIVKRYNEMLPLIITSNIEIDGKGQTIFEETLEERMGSSIASRILEVCKKIKVEGDDFRKSTLIKKMKEVEENTIKRGLNNEKGKS